MQLIFKGILTPALEHAETNINISTNRISLPDASFDSRLEVRLPLMLLVKEEEKIELKELEVRKVIIALIQPLNI